MRREVGERRADGERAKGGEVFADATAVRCGGARAREERVF